MGAAGVGVVSMDEGRSEFPTGISNRTTNDPSQQPL